MPVVDKLPASLWEDLETAFEDDLDNIKRLKEKFKLIHEQFGLDHVMSSLSLAPSA
ncbi:hypothetical protein WN943_006709 [Citrus x changshan-huyou]